MMNFEQRIGAVVGGGTRKETPLPKFDGRKAIEARADLRKRGQEFRVRVLKMERPKDASAGECDRSLSLVFREAKGEALLDPSSLSPEDFEHEAERFRELAEAKRDVFPRYAAFLSARAAKCAEAAGTNTAPDIVSAGAYLDTIRDIDPNTPANLLPDAMILGLRVREAARLPMPDMKAVAEVALDDPALLVDYALALPESDRNDFLDLLPEEKRRAVSVALDASVARVLHQLIVEKGSDEEGQRSRVRLRLYNELRETLIRGGKDEKAIAKILAESIGSLGEDTRQLLLETLRDEYEAGNDDAEEGRTNHAPRVMKVFLDHFDDFRGNDIALQVAGSAETDRHLSIFILGKLIRNGYLSPEVKQWWSEEKAVKGKGIDTEKARLEVIKRTIADLGVVPSREILSFLADDRQWEGTTLEGRIAKIRSSQEEFSDITDNHELARTLSRDERKAMVYYLLHGGDDRFNLINSYDFGKFKEMVGLINDLTIHEQPMRVFEKTLLSGGISGEATKTISDRLRTGHHPIGGAHERVDVSFDVSENALVKNANLEIGRVLGREQLGVVMLFPMYREFLESEADGMGGEALERMKGADTLADRLALIGRIEESHPEFPERAIGTLAENWRAFGEKMILEFPLEQVFGERSVPVRGEELLPRLDTKRVDLKRMKKDLLVILRGGDKKLASLQRDIQKKQKARTNLLSGLDWQEDETDRESLREKIRGVEKELMALEAERAALGDRKSIDRFAHMSEDERKAEVERIGSEILSLTEKSPSAIFTYITMQVLGEDRLRESDIALVQEIESHLQGPFQAIADAAAYRKPLADKTEKKRTRIRLEYLDKTERFMNMVRFADSKICCFSSSNYEQTIQHGTQNKYWVASINADPLSFVISIESPQEEAEDAAHAKRTTPKENLGFIFGSFGADEEGKPAILLNGIYYAPGLEDKAQMESMLSGVERIFDGLPIRTVALAGRHGGSFGENAVPDGYSKDAVRLTRLRALDDGQGDPETKVYDDLATGEDLNRPHWYGGDDVIWHKTK